MTVRLVEVRFCDWPECKARGEDGISALRIEFPLADPPGALLFDVCWQHQALLLDRAYAPPGVTSKVVEAPSTEASAVFESVPDGTFEAAGPEPDLTAVCVVDETPEPEPEPELKAEEPQPGDEPEAPKGSKIRRWAQANGYQIRDYGRIPAYIEQLYANRDDEGVEVPRESAQAMFAAAVQ